MAQLAMLGGAGLGGGLGSILLPMFGSVVGMFLQPGQKDNSNRLNDLKVSTSAYGEGIAIVYGTMRVPGNMFWATDFEEEKRYINSKGKDVTNKKKGNKKGQPVYEYFANFAMGLCEGEVGEVLRVWADSNLIYDKYNPADPDLVSIGFSQQSDSGSKTGKGAGTGKKGGSQESGRFQFTFYPGSEGQMPDPNMISHNAGNATPAHRGLCYLYFEHFALADFGNRIPTITAEVAAEHFRKPIFSYFKQLEEVKGTTFAESPDIIPFATTAPFSRMFFDPMRYRAYTVSSDGAIRIWDLTTKEETERVKVSDVVGTKVMQIQHPNYAPWTQYYIGETKLWNGLGGVNYPTSGVDMEIVDLLGIAASGDLVGAVSTTYNSDPIVFIDPQSWTIKNRFGEFGESLSAGDISIGAPQRSTVISSFDPLLKIPKYHTVVIGEFGDQYFFDEHNEPMSYVPGNGSIYSEFGAGISPGIPIDSGCSYYWLSPGSALGDSTGATITRKEFTSFVGTFQFEPHQMIGIQKTVNSLKVDPFKEVVIYSSEPEDDETSRRMGLPYPIVGAEAIGFLECVSGNTVHPDKNGIYAVKVAATPSEDGTYAVLWRAKIDSSTDYHPELNACQDSVILTGNRLIYRWNDTTVWDIDFAAEKLDIWFLPADCPASDPTQFWFPTKGALYQEAAGIDPIDGHTILECFLDKMLQKKVTPAEIIRDLASRVGIGADRVDTSHLNDDAITGYVMQQPKAARAVADDIMKVFFFDIVESDYTLKCVSRSQAVSQTTITQDDLGFIQADSASGTDNPADYFKETRVQEIDLPQTTVVSYIDAENDYQSGSQHWRRPMSPLPVMQSREILNINVPMSMTSDFAKQTAQKITYSAWAERSTYEFALPWKYMKYDPTDILTFQMDDGLTFVARMSDLDLGQDFSIASKGVSTEMASYDSDVKATRGGGVVPVTRVPSPFVRSHIFDLPYFEDTDSIGDAGFNYYWGITSYGPGFHMASMSEKVLPNGEWNGLGMTAYDVVWGSVQGVIPAPPVTAYHTDTTTIIRLYPAFDFAANDGMYEWVSIADENWPSHDNTLVVGGEIIYFKNVTANDDGSYSIDTLIRGARGTAPNAYLHRSGENFYIKGIGFQDEIEDFGNVNKDFVFRPSAPSIVPAGLPSEELVLTGASHRPWGPSDIRRAKSGTDLVFTWQRQTRLGGTLQGGTGTVPNVEGVEEYEVYILNGDFATSSFDPDQEATYKRKYGPLTTASCTYLAADLAADGFTQSSMINVVVLQRNAFVGRGYPAWRCTIP